MSNAGSGLDNDYHDDHEFADYDDYYDDDGIGCTNCAYSGWRHGCCDDLCRNTTEPEDCRQRIACNTCNPGAAS